MSRYEINDATDVKAILYRRKLQLIANGCEENHPRVVVLTEIIGYIEEEIRIRKAWKMLKKWVGKQVDDPELKAVRSYLFHHMM